MIDLILGGARSGKSTYAEQIASASGAEVVYVATADTADFDAEMQARVAHHRARRPAGWRVCEAPLLLSECLQRESATDRVLLVDCLTLWLSNQLHKGDVDAATAQLLATLPQLPGHVILVSNEVGMGIVPMGELSRRFVDEAGRLHQRIAAIADRATLVAAGLPLKLKG